MPSPSSRIIDPSPDHVRLPRWKKATITPSPRVRPKPVSERLEPVHGSVEPSGKSRDFVELSRVARDAKAERDLQKTGFTGR